MDRKNLIIKERKNDKGGRGGGGRASKSKVLTRFKRNWKFFFLRSATLMHMCKTFNFS